VFGVGSTSTPTMTRGGVVGGGNGGGCGGVGERLRYRRARDREAGVVDGSRSANRSGGLGLRSLVYVDALNIIGLVCGGREGVALLQLVLAGQKALEGGHGGALRGGM
jgi:hypothetical protein